MNFIDLLLGRDRFAVSATNEDSTYLENLKNLKAYDEAGNFRIRIREQSSSINWLTSRRLLHSVLELGY